MGTAREQRFGLRSQRRDGIVADGVDTFLLSNEVPIADQSIDRVVVDSRVADLAARDPAALLARDRGDPLVPASANADGTTHPKDLHEVRCLIRAIRGPGNRALCCRRGVWSDPRHLQARARST